MAALGSLLVSLAVDTARFQSDLGRAAQRLQGFAKDAGKVTAAVGGMLSAAGGAMAVMVKGAIDAADANQKLAQTAGTTVDVLTGLGYAADLSGANTEVLAMTLGKLGKNIAEAANGGGSAVKAFDAMGISVKDATGGLKSSEQVLREVADKFKGFEDGAGKSALAAQIFGEEGLKLIPLLNAGADGLAAMEAEASALGVTMDTETAKAAEAFNDNLTRLNKVKEGLVNRIARDLLPTLQNLTDRMFQSAKASGALDQAARVAATGVKILMSVGAIIVGVFKTVGEALGGVAAAIVSFFSGRFKEAWDIGKNVALDFAGNLRGTANTVSAIWDTTGAKIAASAPANGAKIAAPLVNAAERTRGAAKAIKDDADRVQQEIERVIAGIGRDLSTQGMSGSQVKLFDLAAMGASEDQLERARVLLDLIDQYEARTKAATDAEAQRKSIMEEGRRVYEQTRTPAEQLNTEIARLNDLLKAGAIDWDTYARAQFAAQDAFDETQKKVSEMDEFGKKAAENIQSYMGSAFADMMNGNFKDIASGFTQMINRMVAEAMAAQLARYLFGDMVAGGSGSGVFGSAISSFASSLFGGKAGGGPVSPHTPYLVGEHGPELFVPSTAGNVQASGAQSMHVVQNFTVQGNVDRRTQMQIAAEAQMALSRARRNL